MARWSIGAEADALYFEKGGCSGRADLAESIRVLSGNLWWGKADPEGLVDLIREYEIDVFAAQELGHENAEAISSELRFGCLEPETGFQGMGIALRRPGTYERVPMHFRDGRRVVLQPSEWEGLAQPLDLVNVHFQAPHGIRPFPSLLVRWRQARDLDRFLAANPSDARAIVGDYNATPHWPLYRRYARRFSDGAICAAQREGRAVEATWGRRPGSPRRLRIDHAMVRGLDVESFRVVEIPGSDHSALIFDCSAEVSRSIGLRVAEPQEDPVDRMGQPSQLEVDSQGEAVERAS